MFTARVYFSCPNDDLYQTISWLLAAWYQNGQILASPTPTALGNGQLQVFLSIPEANSLAPDVSNRAVQETMGEYRRLADTLPEVHVLGEDPEGLRACGCPSRSGLILYTHWCSVDPPLRCLDCFDPVPLYRVPPINGDNHLNVLGWAGNYRACDALQMRVSVGERFGERQMATCDSALSREGRGLCAALENITGLKTYYYLHRMRGRNRIARERSRCPGCGEAWMLAEGLHGLFDFRCETCRLLSNTPVNP